jgi:hypothetical protein
MAMPQDRTLSIRCTFNGFYRPSDGGYGGTMSYAIVASNPDMGDIVAPSGQIDIDKAPAFDPNQFQKRVDITFTLAGGCTLQDGTVVPVSWAPNLSGDQGAMVLMDVDGDGKPTTPASTADVEAKWVSGNPGQIEVDDKNEDKNYYFKPGIVVPALNNYYISVDPPLVNRGSSNR